MRRLLVAAGIVVWVALASAGPSASPPTVANTPTKAEQAELDALEKELTAADMRHSSLESVKIARKLYLAQRKVSGDHGLRTKLRRQTLASKLVMVGDYAEANTLYYEALAEVEQEHGPDSREVLWALASIMGNAWAQMRFDEVDPLLQRTLALTKKLDGEHSRAYAQTLIQYASLLNMRNEYSSAIRLYEQSLQIQESLAPNAVDLSLVATLQTLGALYWLSNEKARAITIYNRVIAMVQSAPTISVMVQGSTIWSVSAMYHYGGRDDLAAPLIKQVFAIYTKEAARLEKDKPDDPALPGVLGQLGYAYRQNNDLENARLAFERADAADLKNGRYAAWTGSLAEIHRAQGHPKEALALLEQTKAALTKLSPLASGTYDPTIADVLREMGDFKRAETLLIGARDRSEKQYGKRHPFYAAVEQSMVALYISSRNLAEAERLLTDSLEISEHELVNTLRTGTEADHAVFFQRTGYLLDTAISFSVSVAPRSSGAARLGLTTLLRRKGRVLDAAAASMATIRSKLSPEDKKLLDDLASERNKLAKLTVAGSLPSGGDDYAKEIAALEDRIQKLELQVGSKSAEYRATTQPIVLATIQKLVPKDSRLVEIVNYQPGDPTLPYRLNPTFPVRHYAAYVLATTGDPQVFDLGPADVIDDAVNKFRKAVSNPKNQHVADLGHALYTLTIGKLTPALGTSTDILLAPDGSLNVVPFSALVDDHQDYLIKHFTFTYLTSGRDLLRLQVKSKAQGGGVVFANPSFDATGSTPATTTAPVAPAGSRGPRSLDLSSLSWPQLPGTGEEADEVEKTWSGFADYRGARATETALKALHGPKILHLATHGFFLDDAPPPPKNDSGVVTPAYLNPLLRSGLALAGANKLSSGDDDGILTAMEASGLDLWGTKLVVLSACDTGNGKVTNGDGVYGLRRALVIAGAEGLVMSLWQVDDLATRDLMAGYYQRLKAGRPRSSALRDIQLEIGAREKYAHPYYWASFLAAGDNSPLD